MVIERPKSYTQTIAKDLRVSCSNFQTTRTYLECLREAMRISALASNLNFYAQGNGETKNYEELLERAQGILVLFASEDDILRQIRAESSRLQNLLN